VERSREPDLIADGVDMTTDPEDSVALDPPEMLTPPEIETDPPALPVKPTDPALTDTFPFNPDDISTSPDVAPEPVFNEIDPALLLKESPVSSDMAPVWRADDPDLMLTSPDDADSELAELMVTLPDRSEPEPDVTLTSPLLIEAADEMSTSPPLPVRDAPDSSFNNPPEAVVLLPAVNLTLPAAKTPSPAATKIEPDWPEDELPELKEILPDDCPEPEDTRTSPEEEEPAPV